MILRDKSENVKVDGKVRRDHAFPLGIMDVLSIEKTNERFRILYDCKGRFLLKTIKDTEATFKLCRIKRREMGPNRIPYIVTHDGRTIRYPHPDVEINDTIKLDLQDNKILAIAKFEIGNIAYIISGIYIIFIYIFYYIIILLHYYIIYHILLYYYIIYHILYQ